MQRADVSRWYEAYTNDGNQQWIPLKYTIETWVKELQVIETELHGAVEKNLPERLRHMLIGSVDISYIASIYYDNGYRDGYIDGQQTQNKPQASTQV